METGYIYQSERPEDHYTKISNLLIRDRTLSFGEKSVLFWFLSNSESDFRIRKSDLEKHFKEGREAVNTAFKGLVKKGIISTAEILDKNGQFAGYNYIINEKDYLKQIKPFTGNPSTVNPYPFKKTNNKKLYVENGISDHPLLPIEEQINSFSRPLLEKQKENVERQQIMDGNEKKLRHMSKTVRGKKVTIEEMKELVVFVDQFNFVRGIYMNIKSAVMPNAKACRQAIELFRDGQPADTMDRTFFTMFEQDYHKENQWIHLTPEFVTRFDKWQKYETAN